MASKKKGERLREREDKEGRWNHKEKKLNIQLHRRIEMTNLLLQCQRSRSDRGNRIQQSSSFHLQPTESSPATLSSAHCTLLESCANRARTRQHPASLSLSLFAMLSDHSSIIWSFLEIGNTKLCLVSIHDFSVNSFQPHNGWWVLYYWTCHWCAAVATKLTSKYVSSAPQCFYTHWLTVNQIIT